MRSKFFALLAGAGVPALGFARPALPVVQAGSEHAVPVSGRPVSLNHDWPKYCANLEMTGQARAEQRLSAATAGSLRSAWTTKLSGPVASSPIVVGGTVFVGDWAGTEWAIDAATGEILASRNLGLTSMPKCAPPVIGITSAPAVDSGQLFVAGGDDSFYALDPATLNILWKRRLGDNSPAGGYYGWCSPAVVADRVFQGISSNCDQPFVPGALVALDRASGAPGSEAFFAGPGGLGGGVWSSPAVDLPARSIYVTTASADSNDLPYVFSIIRLSLDDLSIQSAWKLDDFSVPDSDWGSSPTLFFDSRGRLLVGAGQKNGKYYVFDRERLDSGPVWATAIAVGGECPGCGDGTISTAAFDGTRLYMGGGRPAGTRVPTDIKGTVTALEPATGAVRWQFAKFGGPVLAPVSQANDSVFASGGKLSVALDAATGNLLWQTRAAAVIFGGTAISDGRIFFGDTDGNLYCYSLPDVAAAEASSP